MVTLVERDEMHDQHASPPNGLLYRMGEIVKVILTGPPLGLPTSECPLLAQSGHCECNEMGGLTILMLWSICPDCVAGLLC
jgi:hypothetical protein